MQRDPSEVTTGRPAQARIYGRDEEIRSLREALAAGSAARGQVIVVAGDPGMGKTSLAEVATQLAEAQGFQAFWGRSWESGGSPAFWPWVQLLRRLVTNGNATKLPASVGRDVTFITRVLPEVHGLDASGAAVQSEANRFALFDSVARTLAGVSREQPLLLVLDDLHAADASSLMLMRFVAKQIRAWRCVLIGTYRPLEASERPEASDAIAAVGREGEVLELAPLDDEAAAKLIEQTVGAKPSEALVQRIQSLTEGNPLFVDEMVRLLRREGRLEYRLDTSHAAFPVPERARDLFIKRVDRLSTRAQTVISAASVIGREFDVDLLVDLLDRPVDEVIEGLEEATREGLLVRPAIGARRASFSHALVREALYDALPLGDRARFHLLIGEAIQRGAGSDQDRSSEVAHHFLEASRYGYSDERTFGYALEAGHAARRVLAFEQAAEFFRSAADVGRGAGGQRRQEAAALVELGEAQIRAGKVAEGRAVLQEAAEVARSVDDPDLFARAALNFGLPPIEGGIVNSELIELFESALALLPHEDSIIRARLLARLAHEFTFSREVERREALIEEAVAMARRVGSPRDLAHVLRASFTIMLGADTLDICQGIADEILQLAEATSDPELEAIGRLRQIVTALELGRPADLNENLEIAATLARRLRHQDLMWTVAVSRTARTFMFGDFDTAWEEASHALTAAGETPNAMGANLLHSVHYRSERGGLDEIEPFVRLVATTRPGLRLPYTAQLAWIHACLDHRSEARAELQGLVDEIDDMSDDFVYLVTLGLMGETCRYLGDSESAATIRQRLAAYSGRNYQVTMVSPVICYGPVDRTLGFLSASVRDWDGAERYFQRAIAMCARMGARHYLARTQVDYAQMLTARGTVDDLTRADELLDEAISTSTALRLETTLREAQALLEGRSATAPSPARPTMRLEDDYVWVSFQGRSSHLKRSRGLEHLARLLRHPDVELHVLEFVDPGRHGHVDASESVHRSRPGDAGEVLDERARSAYKQRIEQLRDQVDEAESFNDLERAAQAREELDAIAEELARATGLHGRARRMDSPAERARARVTKNIRSAIGKISDADQELGRHLAATIKTGTFCCYSSEIHPVEDWDISGNM